MKPACILLRDFDTNLNQLKRVQTTAEGADKVGVQVLLDRRRCRQIQEVLENDG